MRRSFDDTRERLSSRVAIKNPDRSQAVYGNLVPFGNDFMNGRCMTLPQPLFVILLLCGGLACKSYRSSPGVREAIGREGKKKNQPLVTESGITSATANGAPPDNTLIINKLKLPSEVVQFNRTCVTLQSEGKPDVLVKNYKFGSPLDLIPDIEYTVTVEVYQDDSFVYGNRYCDTSRTFRANVGRNIFAIPVCPENNDEPAPSAACAM